MTHWQKLGDVAARIMRRMPSHEWEPYPDDDPLGPDDPDNYLEYAEGDDDDDDE